MLQSDREGVAQEGSVFAHTGQASGGQWRERESVIRGRGLESWLAGKKCLQPLPSSSSLGRAEVKG